MIRFISGVVVDVKGNVVVLNVAGFGLEVTCSREALSLCKVGERVTLPIYLSVSESGPSLFGFGNDGEREFFLLLINVKGMGAKTAISVLRWLSAREMIEIIRERNLEKLKKVPGIGRKTAERICFELKDKVKGYPASSEEAGWSKLNDKLQVVRLALKELYFSDMEIDRAIKYLESLSDGVERSEERLLHEALKILSG
ncbi:Holliday junction branch migration protein RuvA [Acetomicrobium sp.]|jgi:Holliday junction DNA helicase RuvA|uniref:Holliday junction branch migration protein RuvA n=1 Tax=Acetomicrobium sp. TaxID=1872099 RepID=UPI0016950050|nr:Holliday junction branch migration protein RuvA [Synergistaceae bacterium]HOM97239.1 Holliday junction branch migration protein RuvA [Acetomicrobium sp.]